MRLLPRKPQVEPIRSPLGHPSPTWTWPAVPPPPGSTALPRPGAGGRVSHQGLVIASLAKVPGAGQKSHQACLRGHRQVVQRLQGPSVVRWFPQRVQHRCLMTHFISDKTSSSRNHSSRSILHSGDIYQKLSAGDICLFSSDITRSSRGPALGHRWH